MYIWIIHKYVTNNLGDKLLGKGLEELLNKYGFNTTRLDFTGFGKNYFINFILTCFDKLKLTFFSCLSGIIMNLRYAIKNKPDIIFIGGGQLLLPYKNFIYSLLCWFIISKMINARLIIFSVGTEKRVYKFPKIYKKIIKYVLSKSDIVRLRGGQKLIKKITGINFPMVFDTAYGLDLKKWNISKKKDVFICPTQKEEVLNYGLYKNMNNYYEECYRAIK
jgi:hypothetical protein